MMCPSCNVEMQAEEGKMKCPSCGNMMDMPAEGGAAPAEGGDMSGGEAAPAEGGEMGGDAPAAE
jgi:hypothetical protein